MNVMERKFATYINGSLNTSIVLMYGCAPEPVGQFPYAQGDVGTVNDISRQDDHVSDRIDELQKEVALQGEVLEQVLLRLEHHINCEGKVLDDVLLRLENHDNCVADAQDEMQALLHRNNELLTALTSRIMAPTIRRPDRPPLRVITEQPATLAQWARFVRIWRDAWLEIVALNHRENPPVEHVSLWVTNPEVHVGHAALITTEFADQGVDLLMRMRAYLTRHHPPGPDHAQLLESLRLYAGVYSGAAELHRDGTVEPGQIADWESLVAHHDYVAMCSRMTSVYQAMETAKGLAILAEYFDVESRRTAS